MSLQLLPPFKVPMLPHASPSLSLPLTSPFPSFDLTNQNGREVSLSNGASSPVEHKISGEVKD